MYGLYYLIIYYFSFFYILNIFSIGNFILISGVKEILIIVLFFLCLYRNSKNEKFGMEIKVKKTSYPLFFYIICIIIASIKSYTLTYVYIDIKYYLIWAVFIYISSSLIVNLDRLKQLVWHINLICLTIGITGLFFYFTQNLLFLQWRSAFQLYAIKSFVSTSVDFGALMVIGILFNLILIRKHELKLYNLIVIVFYSYLAYLSYIRSIYLSLILFIFLFSVHYIVRKLSNKVPVQIFLKVVINILVILLCTLIFINYGDDSNLLSDDSFIDRIKNTWPSLKIDSFFWGNGFGTVGRSVNSEAIYYVSDNNFLRVYLNMGISGLIVIVLLFRMLLKQSKDKFTLKNIYISIGVAAFLTDYFTLTPAMLLVYAAIGICLNDINKKSKYDNNGG
ncbi:hypothetical protein AB3U99_21945 [Niallia sp. JL1B1071]|uniref:hypothetical protein n=1 Tax=Niallia tiangongensis TaxID=3237105 RepID=UPI0037DD07E6